MMIWLVFAALTLAVVALLLLPLLRPFVAAPARVEYDIVVYRDQLTEVEKDRERGLLSEDQASAIRTEVHRRMLAAEDAESRVALPEGQRMNRIARRGLRLIIFLAVPAAALALYWQLGSPDLPGQPMAERQKDPDFAMSSLAQEALAKLREDPTPEGFARLGDIYSSLHRYDAAADAYRRAVAMGQADADSWSSLGEALTMARDGTVTAEAGQAFQRALGKDRDDARARFYLGLAKAQAGDSRAAVSIWRDLEKDAPADASWLAMVKEHIATVSAQDNFDPQTVPPSRPSPGVGAPEAAGANPLEGKTPEEQQKFIRAMVAQLAAKLETSPNDLEGWLRLGRAYRVLGEGAKAKQALNRAAALRPGDVDVKLSLAEVQLDEIKDGPLTPEFVKTMREILAIEPNNVDGLYYVGEAEHQAGHADIAREMWQKALAQLAPDSQERAGIQRQLDALGK